MRSWLQESNVGIVTKCHPGVPLSLKGRSEGAKVSDYTGDSSLRGPSRLRASIRAGVALLLKTCSELAEG